MGIILELIVNFFSFAFGILCGYVICEIVNKNKLQ